VSRSERDIVQTTFDAFARGAGFTRKSGTWYRRGPETIAVLQLQKSQWGRQYYVNFALWLLPLAEADHPKEPHCHIRTRLSRLVPPADEARLDELLDLELDVADRERELTEFLHANLLPSVEATGTLEQLRTWPGHTVVEAALVTGGAQRLLAG
jgi:Domain of unknown function (DUF4304)